MNQKKKKTLVCLAGILILLLFVYAGIIVFQDHQEQERKKRGRSAENLCHRFERHF